MRCNGVRIFWWSGCHPKYMVFVCIVDCFQLALLPPFSTPRPLPSFPHQLANLHWQLASRKKSLRFAITLVLPAKLTSHHLAKMRFTPTIHLLATMAGSFILANAYSGDLGGAHKAGDLAIRAAKPAIDSPKVQDMPVSTADKEITTVTITMHDTTMSTTIINTIIDPSKLTPITPCTDSTTAVAPESVVTVTSAVAPESVIPASTSAVLPESVVTVTSAVAPESIGTASGTDTTFLTPGPSIPANNSSYYTS
ncbi:hypothetical protein QBC34DRAFT_494036, partial [Podospora aff. communis PSN243]